MLTKDLLLFRLAGPRIHPQFLRLPAPDYLELAERMIGAFRLDGTQTRGELDEILDNIVNSAAYPKVAAGLRKTLEDRAEFTVSADLDYPAERRQVFLASAAAIRSLDCPEVEEEYRMRVDAACHSPLIASDGGLYADLPDNDRLLRLRDTSPAELLERYNLGLVQGLLLTADHLDLTLEDASPARLRRLFSLVRFHQLLAEAEYTSGSKEESGEYSPCGMKMTIDGPGSVLTQFKSYGLQLAQFFPALCNLEKWKMRATVHWKETERILALSQEDGLVNRDGYGAYIPEEVKMFRRSFPENDSGWVMEDESPFLKGKKAKLIFPDFAFRRSDGKRVFLELFHRWHSRQLLERLEELEESSPWPLAIGVDRAVDAKPEIHERLEASRLNNQGMFLYRDYPTVDRVIKALNAVAGE